MSRVATNAGNNIVFSSLPDLDNLSEFSIGFWMYVNPETIDSTQPVILTKLRSDNSDNIVVKVNLTTKSLSFQRHRSVTPASCVTNSNFYSTNMWCHILVYCDSSGNVKIYRDGSEPSSYASSSSGSGDFDVDTGTSLIFFNSYSETETFPGRLCETSFWDRDLNTLERKQLVVDRFPQNAISNSLLAYFRFEGSTQEVESISGIPGTNSGTTQEDHLPDINSSPTELTIFSVGSHEQGFKQGEVLSQVIENIQINTSKCSIYLHGEQNSDSIIRGDSYIAFSCLNFYDTNSYEKWAIYPQISEYNLLSTCDQGYLTNAQESTYTTETDVYTSSPSVRYKIILPEGASTVWCRCAGSDKLWYAWSGDLIPSNISLDSTLKWRLLGTVFTEESEVKTLTLYQGNAAGETLKLDQVFICPADSCRQIDSLSSVQKNTTNHYNTFVCLRDLDGGQIQPLYDGIKAHSWLQSHLMGYPGWYNYAFEQADFVQGLSIDFIVISGGSDCHPKWVFSSSPNSGEAYKSTDWGTNFEKI